MKKIWSLTTMVLLLALAACSGPLPESISELVPALGEVVGTEEHAEEETHSVHWGYSGEGAPENWAHLGYSECAGQTQSPIDLTGAAMSDLENIRFEYGETVVKILNNGHTIQVDKVAGSQIIIGRETYLLDQFHFHGPSEHTLDGQQFPLEMHLVHKTADQTQIAVVGILIAEGAENSAFAPVWAHLPEEESETALDPATGNTVYVAQDTGAIVNLAALLPAEQRIYRYNGSLTTPPCSTNILWSVMQDPIEMSTGQIAEFTRIMPDNNRPVQAVDAHGLQLDETP